MKNGDQPIRPIYSGNKLIPNNEKDIDFDYNIRNNKALIGLTKREYFAAMALQGYLANPHVWEELNADKVANYAVTMADHLLKELETSNTK
jgi:hypothetical protein